MKFPNLLTQTDHGLMLVNKGDRMVGRNLIEKGEWELQYINVIRKLIMRHYPANQPIEIVDAGANLGVYSLSLHAIPGYTVKVHAIEAQRLIFQILNANIALNGIQNVWTHHGAVSNVLGTMQVRCPDLNQVANFGAFELMKDVRNPDFDGSAYLPVETIQTLTIDSLGLEHCAFIKLDVEGMEHLAIQGALKMLEAQKPIIFFERHKTDYAAVIADLSALGYDIWELPSFNVIAMRKGWELKVTPSRKLTPD